MVKLQSTLPLNLLLDAKYYSQFYLHEYFREEKKVHIHLQIF